MSELNMIDEVESLLRDENKYITCKLLCRLFNLKSDTEARELLGKCADRVRDNEQCVETYFVGGLKFLDNNSDVPVHEYCLVERNNLDKVKSTFEKVTSCQLYCLQTSATQDAGLLYAANVPEGKDEIINAAKTSSIWCKKTENGSPSSRLAFLEEPSPKPRGSVAKVATSTSDGPKETKAKVVTSEPPKNKVANGAKGSLKNMFLAQASKISAKPQVEDVKMKAKDPDEIASVNTKILDSPPIQDENETEKLNNSENKKKKAGKPRRKRPSVKKNEAPVQKRRRIIVASESSEDDTDASEDNVASDLEMTEEKPTDPEPVPQLSPSPDGIRKKRKLVEGTALDADGYLVTTKKWEQVSDSDENEPEKEKAKVAPELKKTSVSEKEGAKSKQAVLTSFFRRK